MRVCYFGTYDPDYARNRTLVAGLRLAGVEVVTCNAPLWGSTPERIARVSGGWKSPRFLAQAAGAWASLVAQHRRAGPYDAMMIGYTGHLDILLGRPLARRVGAPVALDFMVSLYNSIIYERKLAAPGSAKARFVRWVEGTACRKADVPLIDTEANARFLEELHGLPAGSVGCLYLGADEEIFYPRPHRERGVFVVQYVGKYNPVHGVETVVRAAHRLAGEPGIRFELIGSGQQEGQVRALAAEWGLRNVEFHAEWIDLSDLPETFARADVCLGAFGTTLQAERAISHKVYMALAMGQPVITGDSPAIREILEPGRHALLPPNGDDGALAEAILSLYRSPEKCGAMGEAGLDLFRQRFTREAIGRQLRAMLEAAVAAGRRGR
jgi:glycosyltransferase involved in cell wall biosynthesis